MPFLRLIFFFIMIPMSWLSLRWLWVLACNAAGVTRQEVRQHRMEISREGDEPQGRLYYWMVDKSPTPRKFKRLFAVYQLCFVPSLLCFNLALIGCLTHAFDGLLAIVGIVMPGIIVVSGFVGVLHRILK